MFIQCALGREKSRVCLKLVILESGAKARTIKKYLGKGWLVDACNGHVQDLPSGKSKDASKAMWASKFGELPNPPWSWTDRAERVMDKIMNKAQNKGVSEVFIATDPDREGEFIAWRLSHILSSLGTIHRVSFNEITEEAVLTAISEPREIDMSLVNAAIVRRLMDRLVGFRCSKFCRSWRLRSMGRVQTPTLGYIVEREQERESHIPKEYNSVNVISNGIDCSVRFHESKDPDAWKDDEGKHFPNRTSNTERALLVKDFLNEHREMKLEDVRESQVKRKPQPPFTTDTMLQNSSSILGWSIGKTSKIASSLYQSGHITYIRTDSTRTNENARKDMRQFLENKFGKKYLGDGVGESGKKKGNVQDAHEAIRPTNPNIPTLDIEHDENILYRLIWSRFAASQMSASIRERRSLKFSCQDIKEEINGTSSWRIHAGWEEVFSWNKKDIQSKAPKIEFTEGSLWTIDNDSILSVDFTKPPRRYSESSIIQMMKKDGIGRPSTYVSTVSKLQDRSYILKEGSSLSPTENGHLLWTKVAPFYNKNEVYGGGLFSYEFTSRMENNLDHIENSEADAATKWEEFSNIFRQIHNDALEKRREKPTLRQIQFLEGVLNRMDDEQRTQIIGKRSLEELTGEEVRKIIDNLSDNAQANLPPSEKQIAAIIRLLDRLQLDYNDFLGDFGAKEINDLTGGRNGSASDAIGKLIELDRSSPATEKQVSTIISMTDTLSMPIEQAMEAAQTESIETITKSDASMLISNLKKTINSNRRKKK